MDALSRAFRREYIVYVNVSIGEVFCIWLILQHRQRSNAFVYCCPKAKAGLKVNEKKNIAEITTKKQCLTLVSSQLAP